MYKTYKNIYFYLLAYAFWKIKCEKKNYNNKMVS